MSARGREFERLKRGSRFILMGSVAAIAAACQPEAGSTSTAENELFPTQPRSTELIIEPTEQPTASAPVWRPPTIEQVQVKSEGGEIPEILRGYPDTIRLGFGLNQMTINNQIDFHDTGIGDSYRFAFTVRNPSGNLLWAKITSGGTERFSDYPLHFNLVDFTDESGNEYQRLLLDAQSVNYQAIPESANADIVWGGSDGNLPIVVREVLALQDGRQVYSQYWDIATSEWKQVPQLEEELATLPTPEPTATPEVLPTTCFDPELQAKVEADFLGEQGYASRQEALDELKRNPAFDKSISWGGFENGPGWNFSLNAEVMGSSRVSLATQPENQTGDFALCMFAITPNYPDKIIPLIIGVELGGKWSQTTALRYLDSVGRIKLNSPELAEEWIQEIRGRFIYPHILLRFDKPNWERDPLWLFGYDHVLPELRRDGRYVLRYTTDPSKLESLERPGIAPPVNLLGGEFAEVDAVIDDMDPERDIGLFISSLFVLD